MGPSLRLSPRCSRSPRLKTSDFDYELPSDRIAQYPAVRRDSSRLLTLDRATGAIAHYTFAELPGLLRDGDLLIVNDTRVIPARLFARLDGARAREVEILLLREEPAVPPERIWSALARPARALQPGVSLSFVDTAFTATVTGTGERGVRHVMFRPTRDEGPPFETWLSRVGHVPLPPYIHRPDEPGDRERYQTLFARDPGSVAAPTAGLHFTREVLDGLAARGIEVATVTLHVGPGTFRPVATEDPAEHMLDCEPYRIPTDTALAIEAKGRRGVGSQGGRVIAVGTTTVRALESWALDGRPQDGAWRETALFVLPPFEFKVIEGLITNFHLPRSSLLMLVSAFAGRERVLSAYGEAMRQGYRFYSYGDAMLIS